MAKNKNGSDSLSAHPEQNFAHNGHKTTQQASSEPPPDKVPPDKVPPDKVPPDKVPPDKVPPDKVRTSPVRAEHEHEHAETSGHKNPKALHGQMEHDRTLHHRLMIEDLKRRFFISFLITIPILLLEPLFQDLLNYSINLPFPMYILFGLASIVYFYGGWPFLKGLREELAKKQPGMMTLVSLAITVAYAYSTAVVMGLRGQPFFWELATLIDIMLLGHWLEMRSVLAASASLEKLARLMPDLAHKEVDGTYVEISLSKVHKGDVLLVRPGEKIPSDGVILSGDTFVNESFLTGESRPVRKTSSNKLIGGSINGEGSVRLMVEKTGEESYLAQVIKLVRESQAGKSHTQNLSDKAAFWLTIVAITVGSITFISWLFIRGDIQFAMERMATVMVIACPHALGLAIPLVVAVSTALTAQNGLLIRSRTAFENARKISTVLFDKTGTLTKGSFEVSEINILTKIYNEKELLIYAAALEQNSEHPIARAIVAKAQIAYNLQLVSPDEFKAVKGKGVTGRVNGKKVQVVSPGYLRELLAAQHNDFPEKLVARADITPVYLLIDDKLVGAIHLSDTIRPESYEAIKVLQSKGIKCWLVTGDHRQIAQSVAEELGMDGYFAEVLPDQKQAKVQELQSRGEYVAMVGDGINDAPALARANIGIAIGSGTDVAAETADIILVNSNPLDVANVVLFGRATYNKMVQNLVYATGYNIVAIPLAAGVFYELGILISPALGALLMSLSTVLVAINARLLRVKKYNALSK
jgi:Cu2+-exporting ATPase